MNSRLIKEKLRVILRPAVHLLWKPFPLKLRARILQRYYCKHWPDIEPPRTYNEKMLAYMFSDLMAGYWRFADKLKVRDYVKSIIGEKYLTKLYGVYEKYDEIDFSSLPPEFILKTTHGCGGHLPCTDKDSFVAQGKENADSLEKILRTDYSLICGERQYHQIQPRIFAEEYLPVVFPRDTVYRFYAFGGQVQGIQVACALDGDVSHIINNMYTSSWEKAPYSIGYPGSECSLPRPPHLEKMVELAEKLAVPFPFVRVDLYNLAGRIVFSELTFTPLSGFGPILPLEWDYKLGELFPWPWDQWDSGEQVWKKNVKLKLS